MFLNSIVGELLAEPAVREGLARFVKEGGGPTSTCTASGTSSSRATTSRRTTTIRTCRTSASSGQSSTRPARKRIRSTSRSARWRRWARTARRRRSRAMRARPGSRAQRSGSISSPVLGVTRLMHNQGALTDDSKAGVTSLWKELQDYARPKDIKISGETRGSGFPTAGNRGQRPRPPPPPPSMSEPGAPPLRLGHPLGMHSGGRRVHEPRLRRRDPLPHPAGAARRDQGTAPTYGRQHAHACQSDLGRGHRHQVRRVHRLQGALHDRGEPGRRRPGHLQRYPRESRLVRYAARNENSCICRRITAARKARPRRSGAGRGGPA